ncbi:MAG: hypothetical protein JXB03_01125 [Spirochaetales bacterium]|nr:hypothetical protein [Spirochaetales bacterium]
MAVSVSRVLFAMVVVAALVGLVFVSDQLFETNKAGYYQVKQAFLSGKMTVRTEPGVYNQFFGRITEYQFSDMYYFSKSVLEGGGGEESNPIQVRFNDGGTAMVSGSIKFKLSRRIEDQLELHEDFKNYDAVKQDLVRQVVMESLMQTATLMKAEESYSSRRSEFTALAEQQIRDGILDTEYEERAYLDPDGNELIERLVRVKLDEDGKPVVRKISPFIRYNMEILQFVIKDIDFDETIDRLISQKKQAEQEKAVAKAQAEKARQEAITAKEQGDAKIAIALAEEEVNKIRAVTQAKKEKEVAELKAAQELEVARLNREKASEEARAELVKKEAEARANELLVRAGLTPSERAQVDKETAIGVAAELAKTKWPQIMSFGGDNSAMNPIDAIGLNQMLDVIKRMSEGDN